MKKKLSFLAICLILILAFVFTACNGGDADDESPTACENENCQCVDCDGTDCECGDIGDGGYIMPLPQDEFDEVIAATLTYLKDKSKYMSVEASVVTSLGGEEYTDEPGKQIFYEDFYGVENIDGSANYSLFENDMVHTYQRDSSGNWFYYYDYSAGGGAGRETTQSWIEFYIGIAYPFAQYDGTKYTVKSDCLGDYGDAFFTAATDFYGEGLSHHFSGIKFTDVSFTFSGGMASGLNITFEQEIDNVKVFFALSCLFVFDETQSVVFPSEYTIMYGTSSSLPIEIKTDVPVELNESMRYYAFTADTAGTYKFWTDSSTSGRIMLFDQIDPEHNGSARAILAFDSGHGNQNVGFFNMSAGDTFYIVAMDYNETIRNFGITKAAEGESYINAVEISFSENIVITAALTNGSTFYSFTPETDGNYSFKSNIGTAEASPAVVIYEGHDTNYYGIDFEADGKFTLDFLSCMAYDYFGEERFVFQMKDDGPVGGGGYPWKQVCNDSGDFELFCYLRAGYTYFFQIFDDKGILSEMDFEISLTE